MKAFEIAVRAVRRSLPVALLSAAACGGNVFQSNGGAAGNGGGTVTAGGGDVGGGWTLGGAGAIPAGGADPGGASFGGQSAAGAGGSSAGAGGTDTQACVSNTDCEVIPSGCCSCGSGPVSSYIAINSVYESQYQDRCNATWHCSACGPVAFNPNDPVSYYVGRCEHSAAPGGAATGPGRCVVVDLETTAITACKSANDCSLRGGTGCCSSCSGGTLIAINTGEELELTADACGDTPQACAACAPAFSGYDATCSDGRCRVEPAPPPPCTPQNPCPD